MSLKATVSITCIRRLMAPVPERKIFMIKCEKHAEPLLVPPGAGASLDDYAYVVVGPGTDIPVVYRAHKTCDPDGTPRNALFYSSAWNPDDDGYTGHTGGRQDLPGPAGQGTCNTGASPVAAIREHLNTRAFRRKIRRSTLEGMTVSTLPLKRQLRLLDARVDGPGFCAKCMSDMLHRESKYRITQAFAAAARELGFDGIISTSTLENTVNIYIFGPAGIYEGDLEVEESHDMIEVYRECLAQGADLPEIIDNAEDLETPQSTPSPVSDFGDALHASAPLT